MSLLPAQVAAGRFRSGRCSSVYVGVVGSFSKVESWRAGEVKEISRVGVSQDERLAVADVFGSEGRRSLR